MTIGPERIALLAAAAFCAGVIDAIAGGGGLITFPSLLAAGLPPHLALGTNKGQSVFGTIAAATGFWRAGSLDRRRARVTFPLAFVGSLGGAALVLVVAPTVLRPIVLVLLVVAAAVITFRPRRLEPPKTAADGADPTRRVVIIALALGVYDGFFGPGAGTFLILAFVMFLGETLTRASGDAKIANLGSNIAAFTLFALRGLIVWQISIPMAVANLLGGAVGARIAMRGGDRLVRVVVLLVVLALVAKLGLDLVRAGRS